MPQNKDKGGGQKADKGGGDTQLPTKKLTEEPRTMKKWLQENSLPLTLEEAIANFGVTRPDDLKDLEEKEMDEISENVTLKGAEKKRFKAGQEKIKKDLKLAFVASYCNGWGVENTLRQAIVPLIGYLVEKEIADCMRIRLEAQRSHLDTFTLLLGIITSTLGAASSGEAEADAEGAALAILCGDDAGDDGNGDGGDGDGDGDGAVAGGQIFTYVMLALSMVLTFSLALKKLFKMDERITHMQTLQDATNQLVSHYLHQLGLPEHERMLFKKFDETGTTLRNTVLKAQAAANITAYEGADCLREIKAGGGNWPAIAPLFEDDDATRNIKHRSCCKPLSCYPHLTQFNFEPVNPGPWHELEAYSIFLSFMSTHNIVAEEVSVDLRTNIKEWMKDGKYLKYKAALKGLKPEDVRWDGTMEPIEGPAGKDVPMPDGVGGSIL
jgi:hypothetical protein